ncbi:hypothetical protein Pmani_028088 [Petrolisthes manimaculis]|uniref:Uncharacterized protein n=1 Tax=Petrolisthes manimaculis TaxID=1843537 RepID=A0AAE1P2U7_9EUCA|nr:hypothetical protein Pmani_028088 [Petrolisthes manimaculis]
MLGPNKQPAPCLLKESHRYRQLNPSTRRPAKPHLLLFFNQLSPLFPSPSFYSPFHRVPTPISLSTIGLTHNALRYLFLQVGLFIHLIHSSENELNESDLS